MKLGKILDIVDSDLVGARGELVGVVTSEEVVGRVSHLEDPEYLPELVNVIRGADESLLCWLLTGLIETRDLPSLAACRGHLMRTQSSGERGDLVNEW
ncbi:MAG: hypothetical protein ACP5PJ_02390 [Acidimicrobiales bacterium]